MPGYQAGKGVQIMTEMMKKRQNFYEFLSLVFEKEITASFLEQIRRMNIPDEAGNRQMNDGYADLKRFLAAPIADPVEELAVDYAKVFLGAGEADSKAAYPYESVYTSPEGMVMQQAWTEVCALYAAKGLTLETTQADLKEDHVAIELKFMAFLCEHDVEEQKAFLEKHLLNWIPAFAKRVKDCSRQKFYPAAAELLCGFLEMDLEFLKEWEQSHTGEHSTFSYVVSREEMNQILSALKKRYKVCAPAFVKSRGGIGDKVRYREISSVEEIVTDRPSDFSAKEMYYPVMQTMIYFSDTECRESTLADEREMLLLLHPCDINAMKRLDTIFLENGGQADSYYKRLREKVRVVLLQCAGSYENCFCVSMGTNIAGDYEFAVHIRETGVDIQVKDPAFAHYFSGGALSDYEPEFVSRNEKTVKLPEIHGVEELKLASELPFWDQYDDECIGCGGCNTVCPTCSCFDTRDILYDETSLDGERRRVWSSCMLDTFTQTAGGGRARKTAGANMRFKTLHKTYDYRTRFNREENMCVGCGRCVKQCPKKISFIETINGFTEALAAAKEEVH